MNMPASPGQNFSSDTGGRSSDVQSSTTTPDTQIPVGLHPMDQYNIMIVWSSLPENVPCALAGALGISYSRIISSCYDVPRYKWSIGRTLV